MASRMFATPREPFQTPPIHFCNGMRNCRAIEFSSDSAMNWPRLSEHAKKRLNAATRFIVLYPMFFLGTQIFGWVPGSSGAIGGSSIVVCIFFFGLAAIALGKDRVRDFKRWIDTFGFHAFLGNKS